MDDGAVVERDSGPPPKIVVFYSYTGGVGRSATVANLALILANAGYRILVLDLDSGSPTQHRYLRPFIPEGASSAHISDPRRLDCGFAHESGVLDFAGPLAEPPEAADILPEGRESLSTAPYDLILVDAPNGRSIQAERAIDLADLLVLQYSPDLQSIEGGIQVAQAAEARVGHPLSIIPVPMYFDERAGGYTERTRATARQQLATFLHNRAQGTVDQSFEIPYVSDYAVDIRLVILDSPSETRDSLLEKYRRLAAEVVDLQVEELQPAELPAHASRTRYLARYGVTEPNILCVPSDRVWAEWAVAALGRAGITARYTCLGVDTADKLGEMASIAFVASAASLRSPGGAETVSRLRTRAAEGVGTVVALDVDGSGAAATMTAPVSVLPLFGLDEADANALLLGFYSGPGQEADQAEAPVRFPGESPTLSNLPQPIADFTGRDDELEQIRDYFVGDREAGPFTISGGAGIGKSALAREYARRFASQYDTVWTIPAQSARMIRRGLGELATVNGLSRRGNAPVAVLELLAEEKRWLLIYEGADDPTELTGLLPQSADGHVLITTRQSSPDAADQLVLGPFGKSATLDLLAKLLTEDTEASRVRLCDILASREPMTVRLAATWIRERARTMTGGMRDSSHGSLAAVEELEEHFRAAQESAAAAEPLSVVVKLLMNQLETVRLGPVALRILRTCAFMSQSGVSRSLLESPAFLADLGQAATQVVDDPIVLHTVLHTLARHGFLPAYHANEPSVQVHRRLLEVVRATMSAAEVAERESAVIRILAAYAPQDAQRVSSARYPAYLELQRHLDIVDPSADLDPRVRRWLLGQIDFLYSRMETGPWALAAQWGELLERSWRSQLADPDSDPFLLELQFHRANVERARGNYEAAHKLDSETLELQRSLLRPEHPRSLMTARGTAADLRLLGKFAEAEALETSTWRLFRQELGDDHEMTVVAASNLALTETLDGNAQRALERETEVWRRSLPMSGRHAEYPAWSLALIGWHLRELGRYKESRERLVDAREQLGELTGKGILKPTMKIVLTTEASLAATDFRLGRPAGGPAGSRVRDALSVAEENYGRNDVVVLALRSGLASVEHAAGSHADAVQTARVCYETAVELFGNDHPFVGVCAANLGVYVSPVQGVVEAQRWGERGLSTLAEALGPHHPWTLIARLGLDWTRSLMGRATDSVAELAEEMEEFASTSGSHHPVLRAYEFFRNKSGSASLQSECDHVFELELPLIV